MQTPILIHWRPSQLAVLREVAKGMGVSVCELVRRGAMTFAERLAEKESKHAAG